MRLLAFGLALSLAGVAGCGSKNSSPRKVGDDEKAAIEPADMGELPNFASKVEGLVAKGDIAGLEMLWLTPDQLDGCTIDGKPEAQPRMTTFPENNLEKFRTKAGTQMAEDRQGEVLFTNQWNVNKPNYLGGLLAGENCKAKDFARINVIIKPSGGEPAVIEHRFNAELIGEEWRLYRYQPALPKCDSAKGKKSIGCRKLNG